MAKTSPLSSAFGKAIKQIRITKGWTQEDLSDKSGMDRSYISRIERGLKNPSLSVVWELANHLEVSLFDLLTTTLQHLPADFQKDQQ
ncbi:helix-turn-helix domain-containing protein [Fibrisoma limi]|uniref:helix-turn-helix domain-containing protein n=1 Tax=Fibrisoma limi TaxID=663275 RepID=UPI000586C720|nr:helix-turn-helix transcriptional regulator [Fibrisoma limi]